MKLAPACSLILALLAVGAPGGSPPPIAAQLKPRVAVVEFIGTPEEAQVHRQLLELAAQDSRVRAADDSQVAAAIASSAAELSLNMTRGQAAAVGQLLGCEYFILDRFFAVTRRSLDGSATGEALLALFLVDAREGRLVRFEASHELSPTAAEAARRVHSNTAAAMSTLLTALDAFERGRVAPPPAPPQGLIELPAEGSPLESNFQPPKIIKKSSPAYPELAQAAEILATVRLQAQFLSSGAMGEIEVEQWAGYGLDEAAIAAARSIVFTPATLGGKPVSVVAPLEYHFRIGAGAPRR